MRVYRVLEDTNAEERGLSTGLEGESTWSLPGVHCPECHRKWSSNGLSYPSLDLSNSIYAKELGRPHSATLSEYERLAAAVMTIAPPDTVLRPGAELGPLRARGTGTPADVVWRFGTRMFVSEEVLAKL